MVGLIAFEILLNSALGNDKSQLLSMDTWIKFLIMSVDI